MLFFSCMILAGCGRSRNVITVPTVPTVPYSISSYRPNAKAYVINERTFYYDDTDQKGDPSLISIAVDAAKAQIATIKPGIVLPDPFMIVVFEPVDLAADSNHITHNCNTDPESCKGLTNTAYEVCREGRLDCSIRRPLALLNGYYCVWEGCFVHSDTAVPPTWPIITIFTTTTTLASSIQFEAVHVMWHENWPNELCTNGTGYVWAAVGEGGSCDPFLKK